MSQHLPFHVLVLGGSTEASELLRAFGEDKRLITTLSLAGRTSTPSTFRAPTRIGGFGGADGIVKYMHDHGTDLLVDATHPFAVNISRNAIAASEVAGIPLLAIRRPAWKRRIGEHWHEVADMEQAAKALGPGQRRVLLTVGGTELRHFAQVPWHHFVVRCIEPPPQGLLPGAVCITARGPFTEEGERDLLRRYGIEVVVTKNSGGAATYPKVAAAASLGLPVIMVSRPPPVPTAPHVALTENASDAVAWLNNHLALRGV